MCFSVLMSTTRLVLTVTLLVQNVAQEASPTQMPSDRADSYQFYSRLMPVGESANKGWPHDLYLVEDATRQMVPLDQPCNPTRAVGQRIYTNATNPHDAVTPPESDRQDYNEIVSDFDSHCHERITLDRNAFNIAVPVRLLNHDEQNQFQRLRAGFPDKDPKIATELGAKYRGAPGLYTFSEVYFNAHHTVALVYAGVWCGSLCGHWFWSAFRLKDGQWIPLRWASTISMS